MCVELDLPTDSLMHAFFRGETSQFKSEVLDLFDSKGLHKTISSKTISRGPHNISGSFAVMTTLFVF